MKSFTLLICGLILIARGHCLTEDEMTKVLEDYNKSSQKYCNKQVKADWDFQTDVENEEKRKAADAANVEYAKFQLDWFEKVFKDANPENFGKMNRRQLKQLQNIGTSILSENQLDEFNKVVGQMTQIYSSATICPKEKPVCEDDERLALNPDIEKILADSRDYDELLHVWNEWHSNSGKRMLKEYKQYVRLMNIAAEENNFTDAGEMWRDKYEDPNLVETVDRLWNDIEPLYNELHTYVRHKLGQMYSTHLNKDDPMIPAHILGNMWAQDWSNLYQELKPFKHASLVDVTQKMKEQGYTAKKMFQMSDEFYMSLGLPTSNMSYGEKAVIENPEGVVIVCHASAWDFCDAEDFRIKQCTEITMGDFVTVHHEMGHIMYYILYKNQPLVLRTGATPAFHEAVGDTIAMSVSSPKHLQAIGLLTDYEDSEEDNINALFSMALERLAFLPFGLLVDKWRWDVFSNVVTENEWNSHWWHLREKYQKVTRPVKSETDDFDPGSKYHIPNNSQYIAYFMAHLLEFQMYKALCIDAGEYDPNNPMSEPLHKCDFYKNHKAGDRLKKGLSLGSSDDPHVALKALTNEDEINASALLEYFKPLFKFLQEENQKIKEERMTEILEEYDTKITAMCNKVQNADWDKTTDLANDEKKKIYEEAVLENAKLKKEYYERYFKGQNPDDYEDLSVKRQIMQVNTLGVDTLNENDLKNLTEVIDKMSTTYGQAKICPYKIPNCKEEEKLSLDPDLYKILAESTDADEMKYIWQAWREASGKLMRDDYGKYVELVNAAATKNQRNDYGELWREAYEYDNLTASLERMWKQVEPLYDELHFYVKTKLSAIYSEVSVLDDTMPAHLLGNMWAQSWVNLYEKIRPFENATDIDVTEAMQGMSRLEMFQMSDKFFQGLGLESNEMSYTGLSIIEKPSDREIQCHASAWDFCDGKDFRIKMCTNINMVDLITVHHEMGHIQYFILYKDQPNVLRNGANPAFHEAVGDTIALSVSTPQHLTKEGLIKEYEPSFENDINALFKMALERVAFLPFGYLIDKWRWDVFSGAVEQQKWNEHWWNLVKQYQKLVPPVSRGEEYFDPGAKYHVPANSQYIAYFIAHILEFQMHRGLCIAAGQYDPKDPIEAPLHHCDIDDSKEAGMRLRAGLELGLSKHWSEALKAMTNETEVTGDALMEYFAPLYDFLVQENKKGREAQMQSILKEHDIESSIMLNKLVTADWDVATDVNNVEKQKKLAEATLESAQFARKKFEKYFANVDIDSYENPKTKRQLKYLTKLGLDILNDNDLKDLTETKNRMQNVYNTAKICPYKKQECNLEEEGLSLDPEITELLATSTDYEEQKWLWEQWHSKFGVSSGVRKDFENYVNLVNKGAMANNYADNGEMWREMYEDENFIENIEKLWTQVEGLYDELQKYMQRKLMSIYKDKMNAEDVLLPAHLLGNMWAQSWGNLYERTKPFANGALIDVSHAMVEQNYTAKKMFEMSDEFFKNLGLESNKMSYTGNSMIEKPSDREVACHASAWDFADGEDFRIKMCTKVNMEDFITVHHEMGHIQYFILYKEQPNVFRTGANPGFHEAVGDTIALSVSTPKHLKKIGLLTDYEDSYENDINSLYQMALERVAFLPFGYLIDKWRWDVFSGAVKQENWNEHWWNLRKKYQKIQPPVERTEDDFDPAAKFHIPADSQYIAYFVAHILEFQMHRALCIAAGEYDPQNPKKAPLHHCDIDESKEAGKKLRAGLKLGLSEHWTVALKEMTGDEEIKADAILEYFAPLREFLEEENKKPIEEPEEPEPSQLVPIVVGSVVGGLLLIGLVTFLFIHFKNKNKTSQLPTPVPASKN
ncbi:angiotensin-converting enzyme-like [Culicoides brevitarsis]|uniref:angiotensin-converting enzyme-like n=1 Tax=Culicoides brevitarsis TaxID=469753 RepID=UPI00307C346F